MTHTLMTGPLMLSNVPPLDTLTFSLPLVYAGFVCIASDLAPASLDAGEASS